MTDYARRNPGRLNFGSIGNGSAYHLNGEIFKRAAGIYRRSGDFGRLRRGVKSGFIDRRRARPMADVLGAFELHLASA